MNDSVKSIWKPLCIVLAVLLALSWAFFGVLYSKDGVDFSTLENPEQNYTADGGGAIIGESTGNSVSLMSAKIATADYAEYGISELAESAYTLTAEIIPSTAVNQAVDWSCAWKNAGSAWATGKTVTDYVTVTPTADGALTANVECLQAFGESITIKVTSRDNTSASASCTIEYAQRIGEASLSIGGFEYALSADVESVDVEIEQIDLNKNNAANETVTAVTAVGADIPYTIEDEWTYSVKLFAPVNPYAYHSHGSSSELGVGRFLSEGTELFGNAVSFDYDFIENYCHSITEYLRGSSSKKYISDMNEYTLLGSLNSMVAFDGDDFPGIDGDREFLCLVKVAVTGEYSTREWTVNIDVAEFINSALVGEVAVSDSVLVF